MAIRFGRRTEENWQDMNLKANAINKSYKKRKGRVMFPTSHDITPDLEVKKACFKVLRKLLESENSVLITSKPSYEVIKEICQKFKGYKHLIQFRFTITSNNNELLKFWEPGAPDYDERLRALIYAFEKGFKTSVSIEPFLDFDPIPLIDSLTPWITESIWIGKMNYIRRNNLSDSEKSFYSSIRKNYEIKNIIKIARKLENKKLIRFKDSIRKVLSKNK